MTPRERHVAEIKRLEQALEKTNSIYLRRDYEKALKRLNRELREYDSFMRGNNNGKA